MYSQEKLAFVLKHDSEIKALLSKEDLDKLNAFENSGTDGLSSELTATIIKAYETNLISIHGLRQFRRTSNNSSFVFLITLNQIGSFISIQTLIDELRRDERCKEIHFMADGVARKNLEKYLMDSGLRYESNVSDLRGICEWINSISPDIIITTPSPINGPDSLVLHSGKSIFGASKLFLIYDAWSGLGNIATEGLPNCDPIDAVFCNDDLAKKTLERWLPCLNPDRIFPTGTGQLDFMELEKAGYYRNSARLKLGIDKGAVALIYLGGTSSITAPIYGLKPKFEKETFEQIMTSMIQVARSSPDKKFALMLRTHPYDPDKEEFQKIGYRHQLPDNLKYVVANTPISMNEAAYAADILISTSSTETMKAPLRRKIGVFAAFKETGMGNDLFKRLYDQKTITAIENTLGIYVAGSPSEISELAQNYKTSENSENNLPGIDSAKNMLRLIFS